MKKILVFWGSNSPTSINKQLARYAATELQKKISTTLIDLNQFPLPLFNIETETRFGLPVKANELKEIISEYDGYVIEVAEHNGFVIPLFIARNLTEGSLSPVSSASSLINFSMASAT